MQFKRIILYNLVIGYYIRYIQALNNYTEYQTKSLEEKITLIKVISIKIY